MGAQEREALEQEIRGRHERADLAGAAEVALRGYGPEIYGFLHAFLRNDTDADEVFAIFSERLWQSLPSFGWECSFRTWAYVVARNSARNYRDHLRVRARVHAPLPERSSLAQLAERVRSETASYLKTQTKDRVARLRDSLSEEERMLLSLRLDRKLAWNELARVLHDGDDLSDDVIKRESARLRKRFQAIKDKLAELVRREEPID